MLVVRVHEPSVIPRLVPLVKNTDFTGEQLARWLMAVISIPTIGVWVAMEDASIKAFLVAMQCEINPEQGTVVYAYSDGDKRNTILQPIMERWIKGLGVKRLFMGTFRHPKGWGRKFGYQPYELNGRQHTMMVKEL